LKELEYFWETIKHASSVKNLITVGKWWEAADLQGLDRAEAGRCQDTRSTQAGAVLAAGKISHPQSSGAQEKDWVLWYGQEEGFGLTLWQLLPN